MSKVLVVEDDPNIVSLLTIHLKDLELDVDSTMNGREGLELAMKNDYDLIVLDLMLPEMDGLQICQKLRALEFNTPILMLTAKSEEFDKVMGLESGADDYLTKPFGVREFTARVKAILRRSSLNAADQSKDQKDIFTFGQLTIIKSKFKVLIGDEKISLTPKEFELLKLLAEHPGVTFSREQLLESVWGYEFNGYEHTVNSHVNRLRAKIEPDINNPIYVITTWGTGYRFTDEIPLT